KTCDGRAELELLDERHEIDATSLEHGALGEIDFVELELPELVAHGGAWPWQEARPDAVGDLAKPEIEARRLDLVRLDLGRSEDFAGADHGSDGLAGKNAGTGKDATYGFGGDSHVRRLGQALEEPVLRLSGFRVCGWHGCVIGMTGGPRHLKLGLLP